MKLVLTDKVVDEVNLIAQEAISKIDELLDGYPKNHIFHIDIARENLYEELKASIERTIKIKKS